VDVECSGIVAIVSVIPSGFRSMGGCILSNEVRLTGRNSDCQHKQGTALFMGSRS